ncbi:MAG: hypothetical protein ABN490_14335, partial [Pantoea agglomerans]
MHPTQKSTALNSEVRVERHSMLNVSRSSHSAKFALKMRQKKQSAFHREFLFYVLITSEAAVHSPVAELPGAN